MEMETTLMLPILALLIVALAFLLPVLNYVLFCAGSLIVHVYGLVQKFKSTEECSYGPHFWDGARRMFVNMWDVYGRIYHGYEVEGLENIPNDGPAVLIYYHGALPVDYYYFGSKCLLVKGRLISSLVDPFLLRVPGIQLLNEVMHAFSGSVEDCVQRLKQGHLLSISPGGVREGAFSGNCYQLVWGHRQGFAKVALEAKVPIIPIFTVNLREAYRCVNLGSTLVRKVYEKLRLPFVPIYGGLPVKLKTIVGKPIPYDSSLTPEEVVQKTAQVLEAMIVANQRIPGNYTQALLDRFR